jgi:hypothetical protein
MDARVSTIEEALKAKGFTKSAPGRWFNFPAPDGSILEFVASNTYARVVLSDPESAMPFLFSQVTSEEYPEHPKTDFYVQNSAEECQSLDQILRKIDLLAELPKQEAA